MKNHEAKTFNKRYSKLLNAILELETACGYYDEEKQIEVLDATEDDFYEMIMRDDEMHFLGTDKVKGTIHLFFTDRSTFEAIARVYKAY